MIQKYIFICYIVLTLYTTQAIRSGNGSARHRLLQDLLNNYPADGKHVPPRQNIHEAVSLAMSVEVVKVIRVNQEKEAVAIRVYKSYTWRDDFLSWDPHGYDNVETLRLPTNQLWAPDISVYDAETEECIHNEKVTVNSTGTVLWVPSCVQEIGCNVDPMYFPFDKHRCEHRLGSWTYSSNILALDNVEVFHIRPQIQQEWSLYSVNSRLESVTYNNETFQTVVISYWIQHHAPLYAFLLIFPAVLLSVMTSVVFLLPTEDGNKINVGMSIFLSFMVLLHILMDSTPKSSVGVPYLGYYFSLNSLLIALSVFSACIISNINAKVATGHVMRPHSKRLITLMAKLLLVDNNTLTTVTPRDATTGHVEVNSAKNVDDGNNQIRKSWILLASVVDRFLFFVYMFANVIITAAIFLQYSSASA